ncbi:MAG TPA: nuclear transport factor 2 family protein [Allosphingosinicella sp.]|nr:nuclear transport factor 2 family protein [Allosphingosinicella sp.]
MMDLAFRGAAVAMLLALAPSGSAAPPAPVPETLPEPARAAAAAVDAFHAALRRGDAEAALALVADDAIVFEDGRVERTKAEYALHHAGADAAFSKAVSTKRLSRTGQSAGDFALIASESRTKGRFRGQDVDRIMVETMVLRRGSDGAWKIVHIHWSSAMPATE